MVSTLKRLGGMEAVPLPASLRAFGINDQPAWTRLFSSHPPIEARIGALQSLDA